MSTFMNLFEELNHLYEEDEVLADEAEIVAAEAEDADEASAEELTHRVLACENCGALSIKSVDELEIDEETDLANITDKCEACGEAKGFKVMGEFKPYEAVGESDDEEVEVVDDEAEEAEESEEPGDDVEESLDTAETEDEAELEEGIFKSVSVLMCQRFGRWEPVAKGEYSANLSQFRNAHMHKFGTAASDYKTVSEREAKKMCKSYKHISIPDVDKNMPAWAKNYDPEEIRRQKEIQRGIEAKKAWDDYDRRTKQARDEAERKRLASIKADEPTNTPYRGVNYSGGDYF